MSVSVVRRMGLVAALAGLAATLLSALPAAAEDVEASACHLYAQPPVQVGRFVVVGVGGRAECGSTRRTVTVRIRKDIAFWPDETVAEVTSPANTLNIELTAVWHCGRGDGGNFFTETFTNTNSGVQSARVNLACV